jgi:hypothetical protein
MDYSDYDEEADEDHDCEAKPCLNRVFAMNDNKQDELWQLRDFMSGYNLLCIRQSLYMGVMVRFLLRQCLC